MTKDEIILANREFLFPAVFHYYKEPLVVACAKDQYVWDADGNQYLDFFGEEVKKKFGADVEIYRCEHCKTLYLPNPEEEPRTGTLSF